MRPASYIIGNWTKPPAGGREDRDVGRLYRESRLFLQYLQNAFASGQLEFSGSLENLRNPGQFPSYLAPLKRTPWVVYAKAPFAGPRQVLDYVGRYTHRVAISNNRLFDIEDGRVRFHWNMSDSRICLSEHPLFCNRAQLKGRMTNLLRHIRVRVLLPA